MEALKNLGIEWPLFVSQVVNFAIFFYLANRFLYKPILGMLDKRSSEIEKGLAEAKRNMEEAKHGSEDRAKLLDDTKKESKKIIDNALIASGKMKDEMLRDAETKAKEILEMAAKRAEEEKRKMMDEVKVETKALALGIVEKLLKEKLGPETDRRFIENAVK
jgi:F-type H+-transporting ATPase subunit b